MQLNRMFILLLELIFYLYLLSPCCPVCQGYCSLVDFLHRRSVRCHKWVLESSVSVLLSVISCTLVVNQFLYLGTHVGSINSCLILIVFLIMK